MGLESPPGFVYLVLYQLSYLALSWWSPCFVNTFVGKRAGAEGRGGVQINSHTILFIPCCITRDHAQVYDTIRGFT